jgi:tetratricopeptide (TPR) repeat protein
VTKRVSAPPPDIAPEVRTDGPFRMADYQRAQQKIAEQNQRILELQRKVEAMGNRPTTPAGGPSVEEMKRTLVVLNQRYEDLQKENQRLRQRTEAGTAQPTSQAELLSVKARLDEAKRELVQAAETIRKQNQDIRNLNEQIKRVSTDEAATYKDQITYLNGKLEAKESELRALREGTSPATASTGSNTAASDSLRRELADAQALIRQQTAQVQQLKTQLLALQTASPSNAAAQNEVAVLKYKLEQKDKQIAALEQKLLTAAPPATPAAATSDVEGKYLAQIKSLQVLHKDEVDQLKHELAQQDKMLEELYHQLEEVRVGGKPSDKSRSQADANNGEPTFLKLKKTLVQMNERYDQLSVEKQQLEAQLKAEKEKAAQPTPPDPQLTQELSQLKASKESLQKQVSDLTDKYTQAMGETVSIKNKLKALEQDKTVAKQTADGKSAQLASLKTEREQLTQALELARRQLQALKAEDWQTKAAEKDQQLALLQTEMKTLQETLGQKDNLIEALNRKVASASEKPPETAPEPKVAGKPDKQQDKLIAELKKTVVKLNEQNKLLQDERDQLSQKVDDNQQQARSLEETVAQLKAQLKDQTELFEAEKQKLASASPNAVPDTPQSVNTAAVKEEKPKDDKKVKELATALTSAKRQIQDLENQLALARKEGSSDGIDLRAVQEERDSAQQKLASAEKEVRALQEKLKQAQTKQSAKGEKGGKGSSTPAPSEAPVSSEASPAIQAESAWSSGKEQEKAGQWDEALKAYQEANRLMPTVAKYAFALSAAQLHQQQTDAAIQTLTAFIEKDPTNKDAYNQLGKAYLLEGKVDDASRMFATAIPTSALSNYATSLKKQGKMSDAERVLKLALEVNPDDSDLLFNLGNLYNTINNHPQAKETYLKALARKPEFAEAHYNLGLLYSKMGENKNASTHLEKYLELTPNSPNRDAVRAYLKKLKG